MTQIDGNAGTRERGNAGPLEDLLVVDLTRALAGPFCTLMLSDFGARVIKVETPDGGDDTRGWGPPFLGKESAYFLSVNRNKESLALNLKDARGVTILRRLLARADVLVENYRPGTMDRFGLGYQAMHTEFPRLVYVSISGFGQDGPFRERTAYALILQGLGGLMGLTGEEGGPAVNVAVGSEAIWRRFCEIVDPALAQDAQYATNRDRVAHRQVLVGHLQRIFEARPTSAWAKALDEAGVPNGPILSLAEVFAHPQVRHRRMLAEMNHPTAGRIKQTGLPIKLSDTPGRLRTPPPTLGQHTDAILRELGISDADIKELRREKVI